MIKAIFFDFGGVIYQHPKDVVAQVVVYQHKKPFIYQEQLLKLQEEAKNKKLGMWSL